MSNNKNRKQGEQYSNNGCKDPVDEVSGFCADPYEGKGKTVVVGMSGGVDSSVTALLLKRRGYRVIGANHVVLPEDDNLKSSPLEGIKRLTDFLDIPFVTVNLQDTFQESIISNFIDIYFDGGTPNPCVLCNEEIKFGAFLDVVRKELLSKNLIDKDITLYFATGHYVKTDVHNGTCFIYKGIDTNKEQSYMLYRVNEKLLPFLVFPLGGYTKPDVYKIAKEAELPLPEKNESQDVCFIPGSYTDYLSGKVSETQLPGPGPIIDRYGTRLGTHRGYLFYTIGQRKGLGLSDGPWYVAGTDADTNTVTVARKKQLGKTSFSIEALKEFHNELSAERICRVSVRYQSKEAECRVVRTGNATAEVFPEVPLVVTPGQSAVFYEKDRLLGGGTIM